MSTIREISDWLHGCLDALDCSDPHVADALAAPVRKGIAERAAQRSGPDGPWAANVGHYGEQKSAAGLPVGTGLGDEHPRMLDADQLAGQILEPTREGFRLAYGTDPEVKARGQWFHNGSEPGTDGTASSAARGQPPRHFWAATDGDEMGVVEACRALIEKKMGV